MSELARIETVVFLQSVDIFSYCKAEEVLRIAAIAQERAVAAGEKIYSANEPAEGLFCVVRGSGQDRVFNGETKTCRPLGDVRGNRHSSQSAEDGDGDGRNGQSCYWPSRATICSICCRTTSRSSRLCSVTSSNGFRTSSLKSKEA